MSFLSELLSTRPAVGEKRDASKPLRKVKGEPKGLGHTSANPDRAQANRDEEAAWAIKRADSFVASGGKCLILIPGVCTTYTDPVKKGRAEEGHHLLPRGAGGNSQTTVCIPGCKPCHDAVESEREWAYATGFLQRRCDAGKPFNPIRPTPPLTWVPAPDAADPAQLGHTKRRGGSKPAKVTGGKAGAL